MNETVRKILVIDDDLARADHGQLFAKNFPLEGFLYHFVADGEQALRLLERGDEFALILLDMRFEGFGDTHGLDIQDELVSRGCVAPIVILSSNTGGKTILDAWQSGALAYIIKEADNNQFYEDLKAAVVKSALHRNSPAFGTIEVKREKLRSRARQVLTENSKELQDILKTANQLREEIGGAWRQSLPFQPDFQNYIKGWNASDTELKDAAEQGKLLYLNMDFGDGCTLQCPHCFTRDGAIDRRGREMVNFNLLKERILEAKELGLIAVRVLGRGEPTQWVARKADGQPKPGEDMIDFFTFLHEHEITPLVFTRGQVIGDDEKVRRFYGGAHGVHSGRDLAKLLRKLDVSIFYGLSSIVQLINNEMVGFGKSQQYDAWCRNGLRLLIEEGFNHDNPTRLAVESPITNLNVAEMLVRYVLFQMLNISPCMNVYMVAGRAMTYGLGEITDVPQDEFLDMYAGVTYFMRRMGIKGEIGSYAGTKECHDISNGLYLTLNGDIYPCPGYESFQNYVGRISTHTMKQIWTNNPYGRHPQSVCPPKIGTHFPPDFVDLVEAAVLKGGERYEALFQQICAGLGVPSENYL